MELKELVYFNESPWFVEVRIHSMELKGNVNRVPYVGRGLVKNPFNGIERSGQSKNRQLGLVRESIQWN